MGCQYEKYIDNMLNGKLSEDKEMELLKHAESCAECSLKLKKIEDIDNVIKEAVTYSTYKDFKNKTLQAVEDNKGFTGFRAFLYKTRIYIYAFAVILLIAVSMYYANLLMNPQKPAGIDTHTQDELTPSPPSTVNYTDTGKQQAKNDDINDLVTIKEAVNKEGTSPNGDKVTYLYEVPVINIDKPGAQKINAMFSDLEKDQEKRIGDGQSMTLSIKSEAFLNDGIISAVMVIHKTGPGGIYTANYDIENDKEISTKELLERYSFDLQNLIDEINKSGPAAIDGFIYAITDCDYNDDLKNPEEILNKTKQEKEAYVIKNIDKIKVYINNEGNFVFIHEANLEDEGLVVTKSSK